MRRLFEYIKSLNHRVITTVSFYSLGGAYLGAITILALYAGGIIPLATAFIAETGVIAVLQLTAINHQIDKVEKLVNSQRTELLARVDQLKDAMKDAGVAIPEKVDAEHRASAVQAQKDRESS